MMELRFSVGLALAVLVGAVGSASAHHSFVAQYDPAKPKVIEGTVAKLQWMNPHIRFYVVALDKAGNQTNWEVEMGSPNTLIRYGWKRDSLQVGEKVTVDGYLARNGSPLMSAKTVKLADGHTISAGSSYTGAGAAKP